MNCKAVKTWLLRADSLRTKTWPKNVAEHVDGCAACAKVARDLRELEDAWREQAIPAPNKKIKARLLKKIPAHDTSKPFGATRWLFRSTPWLAAAAMFLLGIGLFAWSLKFPPGEPKTPIVTPIHAQASTAVVDRIVDWHLELTNAEPKDRKRLVEENEASLRQELQKARPLLSAEESELAEEFLEDGVVLASIDDPLEEAGRAKALAEKILDKTELAKKKGNDRVYERCHLHYFMFLDQAVNPLFDRVAKMKPPEGKKDWKKDKKWEGKKGPFPPWMMTPPQFQQKQQELRKSFEALRKKGSYRPMGGGFGHMK